MCGFYGQISFNKDNVLSDINTKGIDKSLYNRGPDSQGSVKFNEDKFYESAITEKFSGYLYFRRLAIQDLDDRSNQPFLNNSKKVGIVFNGEIYNFIELRDELIKLGHIFSTSSDTEVVINSYLQWDKECFKKFKGMFAIVIIDLRKKKLLLARDQFGIKPIYIYAQPGILKFASTVNSILVSDPKKKYHVNKDIIRDFLITGVAEKYRQTFISEIIKIDPAEYTEIYFKKIGNIDLNNVINKATNYWSPIKEKENISFEDAVEKTRLLVKASVERHMISDVQVTNTLSGGIDSSSILAFASNIKSQNNQILSYGYINDDVPDDNEEKYMLQAQQKFGSKLNKVFVNKDYFDKKIDDFLSTQFDPVTNLSAFAQYSVYEKISKDGYKVALDGQGADEVFLGYGKHLDTYITYLINNSRFKEVIGILKGSDMGNNSQSNILVLRIKNALKSVSEFDNPDLDLLRKTVRRLDINTNKSNNKGMINELFDWDANDSNLIHHQMGLIDIQKNVDPYLAQRIEFFRSGLQQLLCFEDKNAMRFSVENRVPFLDTDIYEFIFSLKPEYLISKDGISKYVLREAMKDYLPEEILMRRRKLGLTTPMALWNLYLKDELLEDSPEELNKIGINQFALKTVKQAYKNGDSGSGGILFRIYTCVSFVKRISHFL